MPTITFARIAAVALITMGVSAESRAQPQLKIFDSHLHYNHSGPTPFFALDQVLDLFRRTGVAGIVANSRPNRGTQMLVEAKAPGLWVVPFIRPYRVDSDVRTWSEDPAIFEMVQEEYKRGYYKGVGEFHIFGQGANRPLVRQTVDFATERNLFVLAHCDDDALAIMLANNPRAKMIWAHTGFSTAVPRVRELLEKHPQLMLELSYRSGIADFNGGQLSAEWRDLFNRHSDRFLLGSDTWINQRWTDYGQTMAGYRSWLTQLPAEQARRIAHGNAERIYGGKMPD
jgi:Amidohydrolase